MTYLSITLALACLYLAWQQWLAREDRADLLSQLERAHRSRSDEIRDLHQRIQAPDVAVAQHAAGEADGIPKHLPADGGPYEDQEWDDYITEGLKARGIDIG